jgi:hypothetical protein
VERLKSTMSESHMYVCMYECLHGCVSEYIVVYQIVPAEWKG